METVTDVLGLCVTDVRVVPRLPRIGDDKGSGLFIFIWQIEECTAFAAQAFSRKQLVSGSPPSVTENKKA